MSLFPDEDVLTREIETWKGFIDKLPSEEDKAVFTKLLDNCYKYAVAINSHDHPFSTEPSSWLYYYHSINSLIN
jgi:hypothetical protein